MFGWLARWRARREVPLHGGLTLRRVKRYAAQSGYVYEYFFLGRREIRYHGAEAIEFVFEVSAGPETGLHVTVILPMPSLEPSETVWGRKLATNEHYAVAKMALFQAFDERSAPADMRDHVIVRPADAAAILATLGFA
jgi:hypothetical protein